MVVVVVVGLDVLMKMVVGSLVVWLIVEVIVSATEEVVRLSSWVKAGGLLLAEMNTFRNTLRLDLGRDGSSDG